jgi:ABC-2 type transport system permease protein
VLKREIILLSKDVNIISVMFLAPLFYSFLYGTIYWNKVETEVPIIVVDNDCSEYSQKLIRFLDSNQNLAVNEITGDYGHAKSQLENGSSKGIIFIPKDFENGIKKGNGGYLKTFYNTTQFLVSNDINKGVTDVVLQMNSEIKNHIFKSKGYTDQQTQLIAEPIKLDLRPMFNFTESYGDYLIPAILVLIIQQTLLIGLSESVAKENENNSLKEWYSKSESKTLFAIAGKGFFYFVLYSAYTFFFFTFNFSLFKINFLGSANALTLLTLIFLLAVILWSIFISSFFRRKIVALQFLTLTSYPVFLISGYSWPMFSMPLWLQILSNLLPSTPYFAAFTRITQMGANFENIIPELIHLSILAAAGLLAAYLRMHKLFNKVEKEVAIKV